MSDSSQDRAAPAPAHEPQLAAPLSAENEGIAAEPAPDLAPLVAEVDPAEDLVVPAEVSAPASPGAGPVASAGSVNEEGLPVSAGVAESLAALETERVLLADLRRSTVRDRWLGLLVMVAAFAANLGVSYAARESSRPMLAPKPAPVSSAAIAGFPAQVDPLTLLERARSLTTRGDYLRGIVVEGLHASGTVDVRAPSTSVRFTFQSPAGHGPQPQRPTGVLSRYRTCGLQRVLLRKDGIVAEEDRTTTGCKATAEPALPPPRCTLKEVFAEGVRIGMPASGLARVEYYLSAVGPAYRLSMPRTRHRLELGADCKRHLTSTEARGSAP